MLNDEVKVITPAEMSSRLLNLQHKKGVELAKLVSELMRTEEFINHPVTSAEAEDGFYRVEVHKDKIPGLLSAAVHEAAIRALVGEGWSEVSFEDKGSFYIVTLRFK